MSSAHKTKASRGCWTCKDRRVRCDRGLPSCSNCARVKQVCQGYGLRLSWPKDGDTRRSMTGGVSASPADCHNGREIELVHTFYFDIEMYYYLVELRSSRADHEAIVQPANLILPVPVPLKPIDLNAEELELLRYFQTVAFSTLATFNTDLVGLREILVRMALVNDTMPSRAVLHALLALSSLHRDGMQLQSAKHKTAAVGALGASAKSGIRGTAEAAQHVAANMLLCSYEIHMGNDTHGHWPWYLVGARDIIRATSLEAEIARTGIGELVLWTYYHDVLARFTLFHWRRGSAAQFFAKELGAEEGWQRDLCALATKLKLNISPLPTILRYLGDIVDALCGASSSSSSGSSLSAVQEEIHALERSVWEVPEHPIIASRPGGGGGGGGRGGETEEDEEGEAERKMALLTELYRTAVLVYAARLCESRFGEARGPEVAGLLARGFALLGRARACERLFPLFVLGCEAGSDERRLAVLDCLRRTERTTHVRALDCLRRGLDSVWVQDDLHADQDVTLDYVDKLNVVIGSSPTLPTMV
ncbi:putative N-terminal fungal transcription regulatory domain-containing protein [Rosellinia necatrix]|uniref:Putative N-terminal fungal transcription regulatory domain-containing protein n=1 Tax=Rosellinia necatrix TaxID=77044 RepID=A0A1S7UK46_ROSNE|nr:putative N-terminal fungal transcription regulatory domain-containing protein [Rosellinia necatrix]